MSAGEAVEDAAVAPTAQQTVADLAVGEDGEALASLLDDTSPTQESQFRSTLALRLMEPFPSRPRLNFMRHPVIVVAVVANVTLVLAGCGNDAPPAQDSSEDAGDCLARVELRDDVYRPVDDGAQDAPRAAELGKGQVIDCDGTPVPDFGMVTFFALVDVDPAVAVAVVGDDPRSDLDGIYVAEGIPDVELPPQLKTG